MGIWDSISEQFKKKVVGLERAVELEQAVGCSGSSYPYVKQN